jgi:hypothetical protein
MVGINLAGVDHAKVIVMTNPTRRLLPLLALALALAGCVAYPAGYYGPGYGYAPTVAVAVPCCAYGGGWHGGGGYGYHRW